METTETRLAEALARIAHQACRNGEKSQRSWPRLEGLPSPASWQDVGKLYAPQVLALLAAPLVKPNPGAGAVVVQNGNVVASVTSLEALQAAQRLLGE